MVGYQMYTWPTGAATCDGTNSAVLELDYGVGNMTTLNSSGWVECGNTHAVRCTIATEAEVEANNICVEDYGAWENLGTSNTFCRVRYDNSTTATNWVKIKKHCNADYDWGWGNTCYANWKVYKAQFHKDPADRLREIISGRAAPAIHLGQRRSFMPIPADIREQRARETLRRVIGDDKFRNFLRTGFVSVRGKSGLTYQIFPSHGITCVYDKGQMTERLCVVLKGDFAPTDSLIMRYILILNNEQHFRSFAIKHNVTTPSHQTIQIPDQRNLIEIFNELKGKKVA